MKKTRNGKKKLPTKVDLREQLFNEGLSGRVTEVSTSRDLVTQINGILIDIDPDLFRLDGLLSIDNVSPIELFQEHLRHWLSRHELLNKAEVRFSGCGLHVLLWLDTPINLVDDLDRQRWINRIRMIQRVLPSDPRAPDINALTRPINSVNGKNHAKVASIREGSKITEADLIALFTEVAKAPLRHLLTILFGPENVDTCPFCAGHLNVSQHLTGKCYTCGQVSLEMVMARIFVDRKPVSKSESPHAQTV